GDKILQQVAENSAVVVEGLNSEGKFPVKVVLKPTVKTPDEILALCREANHAENCIGLITWLHTFSPARMWIAGLSVLEKPLMQFHTQFNRQIPWDSMDMDFMNLNQTAHGGREFGFIGARMRKQYSVVVGHWQDQEALQQIDRWIRVAAAVYDSRKLKVARFGDNMREVAVTEGDKVAAQIQFGYAVNGYAMGDLVKSVDAVADADVARLVDEYDATYQLSPAAKKGGEKRQHIVDAARIELGIRNFLVAGGFAAFTTTFENLYGISQLPGLACQRLMQQGFGFAAEGDWKTAALLRTLKVMSHGLPGGSSFMEDYTYDFTPGNELVIGAHMLEVCPSIAGEQPLLDVQYLGIGKKDDPARLLFAAKPGPALNASLIDMGNRFRLIVNQVEAVPQPHALPNLPVARVVWKPLPNLKVAAEAWILAGGAHHSVYSQAVTAEQLRILAQMFDIEFLLIDGETKIPAFRNEINWNEVAYGLRR
ncbi:MAG: L-arabinose isomerase, partial [Propionivibrio sp.]